MCPRYRAARLTYPTYMPVFLMPTSGFKAKCAMGACMHPRPGLIAAPLSFRLPIHLSSQRVHRSPRLPTHRHSSVPTRQRPHLLLLKATAETSLMTCWISFSVCSTAIEFKVNNGFMRCYSYEPIALRKCIGSFINFVFVLPLRSYHITTSRPRVNDQVNGDGMEIAVA